MRSKLLMASMVMVSLFAVGCGGTDGGGPTDGGGGGTGACAAAFSGCTTYTASDAGMPVIEFGGTTLGNTYSPKCLKIAKGTTVRFSGAFGVHPLAQACGPAAKISNGQNTAPKDIVFDQEGVFGYYCTAHGTTAGAGMAGSIEVTP